MIGLILFVIFGLVVYYFLSFSKRIRVLEEKVSRLSVGNVAPLPKESEQALPSVNHPNPLTVAPQTQPAEAPITPAVSSKELSASQVVGGIGVIALVLGIGFFFKYAIDQGWINETARIALGGVIGALVLALSEIWHRQKTKIGKVLTAGALGVWYFTIFAAYDFYGQIGPDVAFALFIAVTAVAVAQSYRYSSKELGVVSLVAAFLAPALVDFGSSQQTVLFTYLTIINAGALAVLSRRYWLELPVVVVLANFLHFTAWFTRTSTSEAMAGVIFLLVNYALFVIIHSVAFRSSLSNSEGLKQTAVSGTATLLAVYSVLAYFGLTACASFAKETELLPLILAIAGVAVFLAYTLVDRLEAVSINWVLSWVGKTFFVSAIFWQFDRPVNVMYVLLLSLIGFGIGFGVRRRELRASGVSLLILSSVLAFVYNLFASDQGFLSSPEFWIMVLCWIGLGVGIAVFQKYKNVLHVSELNTDKVLTLLLLSAVWLQISWELGNNAQFFSGNAMNLIMSLWWMGLGVSAILIGLLPRLRIMRVGGATLVAAAIAKVFLYDSSALEMGYRVVSFVVLGVILIVLAFSYEKNKDRLKDFLSV